ncbi:DUF4404 family protein [Pseudomonas capeferrum]|uniref:DUF4404 family protein n=1 Tax=Pseudomonas capeferrum TaxID=1495066 RepID=UPI0015E34D36|nr:DUF4404 family protein [Pseudomonas capeferrum]MBA1202058.1 DUF4404 family protein [Pseudomonas capeferrum]
MPARELQEQLDSLREQLEQNPPITEEEREQLHTLMSQIEAKIRLEEATHENNVVDGVNLAVERFEVAHPDLTATLRNIATHLHSMGI